MFLPGYGHYLRTAASLQWDETVIDLDADAAAWPRLPSSAREHVLTLLAGFCVGEQEVADALEPFAMAAPGPDAAACFRAQAIDEARHARFFDRVAERVTRAPGSTLAERRELARSRLDVGFLALFDDRLSRATRGLAVDAGGLREAVGLYHMLLEGIVFTAGVTALLDRLAGLDDPLPGLRCGTELVLRDERWHIGFGASLLAGLGIEAHAIERLLEEGGGVAACWGSAVSPEIVAGALSIHRRRLLTAQASSGAVAA